MPESPEMGAWNQCFLNDTFPRCSSGLRIKSRRDPRSPFFPMKRRIWVHLQSYEGQPAAHVMSQKTFCAQKEGAHVMARASDITPCCVQPGLIVTWWDELVQCEDTIEKFLLQWSHAVCHTVWHTAGNGNTASSSSGSPGDECRWEAWTQEREECPW